jgi:hypothetical protein
MATTEGVKQYHRFERPRTMLIMRLFACGSRLQVFQASAELDVAWAVGAPGAGEAGGHGSRWITPVGPNAEGLLESQNRGVHGSRPHLADFRTLWFHQRVAKGSAVMGGPFDVAPYPPLQAQDFGPGKQYRVEVHNGGKTVVLGDPTDAGFQFTPTYLQPGPDAVDVVIHGLPGRFIEKLAGRHEIPVLLVAQLIEAAGIQRGTPLRLLTCHAGEAPFRGPTAAQQLATEWGGPVEGPNGLLRIYPGRARIDLVDWVVDPSGGMMPDNVRQGQGAWVPHSP